MKFLLEVQDNCDDDKNPESIRECGKLIKDILDSCVTMAGHKLDITVTPTAEAK